MKNYSRQREAILNVLRSTDTHPTANWIYENVREVLPNISLGTVYRNLSDLSKAGEILCINVGDGFDHYDGDIRLHAHLHCKKCDCITDARLTGDPLSEIAEEHGFIPQIPVYVVYGICKNCKKIDEISGGN
ncbi:MAG: transcriptional repressor [Acutalibacteraceae bacterium]|nr:transcriptional repressor [Acutalibacteraceae bacterium]